MIIWLASYPKSGNTWLRFFIISLLMGKKTKLNLQHLKAIIAYPNVSQFENLISNFLNLDEVAKNWIVSQQILNSDKSLRFLKTHNIFGKYKGYSFTDNENTLGIIHVVRDPRNVITSVKNHFSFKNYEHAKEFLFNENKVITLSDQQRQKYLNKQKHPLPQLIGSWKTNYLSWKNMKKNYLLVKYEDLVKNKNSEFTKIANFLSNLTKINFDEDQIKTAIDLSSFDKLDKMEKEHGFAESTSDKDGNKNKFFFLGPKNKWQNILEKNICDDIEKEFKSEMKDLGYL